MAVNAPFEVRIVRVRWVSRDTPLDLEAALAPIALMEDGQGGFVGDVSAYPEVGPQRQGQIAVFAPVLGSPPTLVYAGGASSDLSPVHADDGRIWWIEKGKWKKAQGGGYHDASLCRHAGDARIEVGQASVRLRIAAPGFSTAEFDTLLEEFRNGLWRLVLEAGSPATATDWRGDVGISDTFLDAVRDHIRHANQALAQPHRELRERQERQPLVRVRPTTRTFQELALRGLPRLITGRGHAPSFDTPENRQLLAMSSRLLRSLRGLCRAAQGASRDFQQRALEVGARADWLGRNAGWTQVDPARLERELDECLARQRRIRRAASDLLTRQPLETKRSMLRCRLTSPVNEWNIGNTFYGNGGREVGCWAALLMVDGRRHKPERIRLVFNHPQDALAEVFIKGETYTVRAVVEQMEDVCPREGRRSKRLRLTDLADVRCASLDDVITRLQTEQRSLKRHQYLRKLGRREKAEQRRDREAEARRAERFRSNGEFWDARGMALQPLMVQLDALIARAGSLGISWRPMLTLSGSMTYVQNPNYRGALTAYRRALEAADVDGSTLDQLLRLDDVGILDLPMVYERWCLLMIIRVLREHFGLVPERGYRGNLFARIAMEWRAHAALAIRFEGKAIQRDLLLEYQPRLEYPNGRHRTPDFALTIIPRDDEGSSQEASGFGRALGYAKLVLDAKCKRFDPVLSDEGGAGLADELQELIAIRQYDQRDRNRVFVLHPGRDSDSTRDWRRYCHYGAWYFRPELDPSARPDWDRENPDHRHGAVLLRPGAGDHLIRLLTMHLYLGLDDSLGGYNEYAPHFPPVCPACGGRDLSEESPLESRQTNHVGTSLWCKDCGQMIVRNASGGCGTRLWKLGSYWTFHETHPLNPYNIKCPHCGDYMPTDDNKGESEY